MTKQTDTSAAAAKPLGVWIDELKADRDEWKARAERLEGALESIIEQANFADDPDHHTLSLCKVIARAALAQTGAEPGLTLADAYRAGLEAAAKRHVYYAHQYERINAMADAEAHMEHARQIRALDVPTEFGGE